MLFRFIYRSLREVSLRLAIKAAWLWCFKGLLALRAYKKRVKKGILFPPFLFFSLTGACNLRCRGCWVTTPAGENAVELPLESIENTIRAGQKESVFFYTLLGGEPFLASTLWEVIQRHPEAYFQVITNGQLLTSENVTRLKKLGNVSPLISIDGNEKENDSRRGEGTHACAVEGCRELQRQRILYGIATVVTESNFESVLTEEYVQSFIDLGALYLWFYVFRSIGDDPAPELVLDKNRLIEMRHRLVRLRRRMPIILIDTYWDANGRAVCPASKGMSFVVGPRGGIEPCPPLNVARQFVDGESDVFKMINESDFLRRFQRFIEDRYDGTRSQGCVILDHPHELANFFRQEAVVDVSGRDLIAELATATPKNSHYLPGEEIPEDYWVYRILKKTLFFGMGAYG